jgi:phospholipid/cholesterol/gamma-HCH transport system substrate-binding protein
METRANHFWVGAITLALFALAAGFIVWIARLSDGAHNEYDIFFQQSVDGLADGAKVAYNGVPVGQIKVIELWKKDPGFVRVRISVNDDVPVTIGTTATIQGSFTGVSDIQLEGAVKDAPKLTEPGPEGVPVIPTKRGGLGELLNSAPVLLERLATLTERMNLLMGDKNQASIAGILSNTDKMTGDLAQAAPRVQEAMAELKLTLRQATVTLARFDSVAGNADSLIGSEGKQIASELRDTLKSANAAAGQLATTLGDVRPAMRQLSGTTLPEAEATIRDLRATTRALRQVTEKIDDEGAGALVGGSKLPDYKP